MRTSCSGRWWRAWTSRRKFTSMFWTAWLLTLSETLSFLGKLRAGLRYLCLLQCIKEDLDLFSLHICVIALQELYFWAAVLISQTELVIHLEHADLFSDVIWAAHTPEAINIISSSEQMSDNSCSSLLALFVVKTVQIEPNCFLRCFCCSLGNVWCLRAKCLEEKIVVLLS